MPFKWPLNCAKVSSQSYRAVFQLSGNCQKSVSSAHMLTKWLYNRDVLTNILKIYELPKVNNRIPKYCQTLAWAIIIYQANSMSQLHMASKLCPY